MIATPSPDKIAHYQKGITACIVTAKTEPGVRDLLRGKGFRWHTARRNWYKFGDNYESLSAECIAIWQSHPGLVLFKVFAWDKKPKRPNGIPF